MVATFHNPSNELVPLFLWMPSIFPQFHCSDTQWEPFNCHINWRLFVLDVVRILDGRLGVLIEHSIVILIDILSLMVIIT